MERTTKRTALAQVLCCVGCCCGRPDRGHPPVPVERLKAAWRTGKLNGTVQLTISGCLGPCDRTNVTLVLDPHGGRWLGGLTTDGQYDELIAWATACRAAGAVLPLPPALADLAFERWPAADPAGRAS